MASLQCNFPVSKYSNIHFDCRYEPRYVGGGRQMALPKWVESMWLELRNRGLSGVPMAFVTMAAHVPCAKLEASIRWPL